MENVWLKESLFSGMTANAFKLGTVLTLGWFWPRVAGCSVLYRGSSMGAIGFVNILTVTEANAQMVSVPSYVKHSKSSTYFYVIRRLNCCGQQEHTLAAAVKVAIDADGNLVQSRPNSVFGARIEQVAGSKVQLSWFYCPLEQESEPVCFKIYYDSGTGQIDYQNFIAMINYKGQRFYNYRSDTLDAGRYLFAIRTEDIKGLKSSSSTELMIQIVTESPDAVDILGAKAI